jgi:hypothetical protein
MTITYALVKIKIKAINVRLQIIVMNIRKTRFDSSRSFLAAKANMAYSFSIFMKYSIRSSVSAELCGLQGCRMTKLYLYVHYSPMCTNQFEVCLP